MGTLMYLCGIAYPNANFNKRSHYSRIGKWKGPIYSMRHTGPSFSHGLYLGPREIRLPLRPAGSSRDSSYQEELQAYSVLGMS